MQIRLFSRYILVAIFAAMGCGLSAQNIEVENACAAETTTFKISTPENLLGDVTFVIDGVPGYIAESNDEENENTLSVKDTINTIRTIVVSALWEEEVIDTTGEVIDTVTKTDTLMVDIEECPCDVMMPNIFTPDVGEVINRTFGGMYRDPCFTRYEKFNLRIYSRSGKQVFDSCDTQGIDCKTPMKWDGKSTSGKDLPPDTYIYVLVYQIETIEGEAEKEVVTEHGEVLLLR